MLEPKIINLKINNSNQRIEIINFNSFDELDFYKPLYNQNSFNNIVNIYEYFIDKYSLFFSKYLLFSIPLDYEIKINEFNNIYDPLIKLKLYFDKYLEYKNNEIIFKNNEVKEIYDELNKYNCLKIIKGKLNNFKIIPINHNLGYLSDNKDYILKTNSSFFIMDPFDIGSIYDSIGTTIGLCLKDGKIINPPLYNRETLLVDYDNNVSIKKIDINDIDIIIDNKKYNKNNSKIYTRLKYRNSPKGGYDLIIVGDKIISLNENGNSQIPSGGFVLKIKEAINIRDINVRYEGLERYKFAIQVGNSIIIDGIKTNGFKSNFSNIYNPISINYPPCLYPLDFKKDKAARMLIGIDKNNNPLIIWVEGKGKYSNDSNESLGLSLDELGDLCLKLELRYALNLDGGGSSQILFNNKRQLKLSDRDKNTYEEIERAIPIALFINK